MNLSNKLQAHALIDELLLVEARNRIKYCNIADDVSHKDLLRELGISASDLKDISVEIE